MVKKAILLLSAALSLGSAAKAQWCATDEEYKMFKEQYPQQMAAAEKQMAQQMNKLDLAQLKTTADDTFRIPVVVHVVHDYQANYVTDERIYELINKVNVIYQGKNSDLSKVIAPFQKYIGVPNIQFYLASKDPFGRPTKGITHRFSYLTQGGDDQAKYDLWAPNYYLNIWVIDQIGRDGVAAYSRFPSMAASEPFSDGIITGHAYVGNGNDGTTIAHEIGHYLNLIHVWGNTEVATQCGDDEVDDTPPTLGHFGANGDCGKPSVLYDTTCINTGSPIGRVILDTTDKNLVSVNNTDGVGIDFVARTGITIDTVRIYPESLGEVFDIALLKYNSAANRFDTLRRLSENSIVTTGRPAPSGSSTTTGFTTGVQQAGIMFEALKAFRLESVDIYPASVGAPFQIALLNGTDTLNKYTGVTTTNTSAQTVPLNFFVAKSLFASANPPRAATSYRLVVTQNPGLMHDSIHALPATDTFVADIIALTKARDTAAGPNQHAYNYMYNWQVRHKGVTYTDTGAQEVGLKFFAASDSGYRLAVIKNPGLKTDSVAVPLYTRDLPCIVTLKTHLSNNNKYNGLYFWRVKYGYVKNCIDYPDTTNTQNIMDYSTCPINFTKLQVERMRTALQTSVGNRNNLVTRQTHLITGIYNETTGTYGVRQDLPIVPDFSVERTGTSVNSGSHYMCANDVEFVFQNRSWGDTVESVTFEFPNGTPATSTKATGDIKVKFNKPGWADVLLTAKGNNTAAIKVERTPVYAADPNYVIDPIKGYYQEFGDKSENEKWPIFNYFGNEFKWQVLENNGFYDKSSIMYSAYDKRLYPLNRIGAPEGDYDDFFTPAFDLSQMKNGDCNINFMYSGAFRVNNPDLMLDKLEIAYSTNCGSSWTTMTTRQKADLANKGSYQAEYAPLWMGDWALASVNIPAAARESKVFFRFRYKPSSNSEQTTFRTGVGNNFYIDRINVSNFPLGVNTLVDDAKKVQIAPNPTTGSSFIVLQNNTKGTARVQVTDITGKVVYRTEAQLQNKVEKIEIPAAVITVKGIYLVQIITGDQTFTEKLVSQ